MWILLDGFVDQDFHGCCWLLFLLFDEQVFLYLLCSRSVLCPCLQPSKCLEESSSCRLVFRLLKLAILDITCAKSQSLLANIILVYIDYVAIQLRVVQKTTLVFLCVCILRIITKHRKMITHQAQLWTLWYLQTSAKLFPQFLAKTSEFSTPFPPQPVQKKTPLDPAGRSSDTVACCGKRREYGILKGHPTAVNRFPDLRKSHGRSSLVDVQTKWNMADKQGC